MVNAQEWLDKEYPIEKRNEITKLEINKKDLEGKIELRNFFNLKILNCSDNKLTDLKLNDCRELTELICYLTPLTSTDFLLTLPNPEKLTILDLGDNNFAEQDLGFLQRFTGLEKLYLWTLEKERIDKGIYNRFFGSLKYLRNMKNLEKLGIANTDIDSGLEYLVESKLEFIISKWFQRDGDNEAFGERSGAKVEKIFKELLPYTLKLGKGKYDLERWTKVKLIDFNLENEKLRDQVLFQQKQVEKLTSELGMMENDQLARKKSELEQLFNNCKNNLDENSQGYLEIFIQTNNEVAKKHLLKKINEKELQELFSKQQEVSQLEVRLTNLQQMGIETMEANIVLPPPYSN